MPREYFYTIKGDGKLYHDSSELTDKHFLDFFFKRIKLDPAEKHKDYPYLSKCAGEMNYVQSSDTPIVFHTLSIPKQKLFYAASLWTAFKPGSLVMNSAGFVYHPHESLVWGRFSANLLTALADKIEQEANSYYYKSDAGKFLIRKVDSLKNN